ncbi:hypothetical protein MTR64_20190, partial [Novosphingobium sp. 2580]|nr:hypothetical protein [Novosphingobium album (ex Hu et al. 2023)]
ALPLSYSSAVGPVSPGQGRAIVFVRGNCQAPLALSRRTRHGPPMEENPGKLSREERLAAKLRENLHRRKAQARAVSAQQRGEDSDSGRLPKSPPES